MGTHAKSFLCLVSLDFIGQKSNFLILFYQSVENGFASFHLYVCAAFLKNFSQEIIQENDFQVCLFVCLYFTCSHFVLVTLQDVFFSIAYYRELNQLRRRRQLRKTISLMIKITALHVHHAF